MDDGWSRIDDGLLMMDNGLPRTSYPSLIAFLAGAFVFQENNPRKIGYASLVAFLAGAFVFQENTPRKISYASLVAFLAGAFVFQENTYQKKLCVSDHVPSRGFCFPGKVAKINISLAGYFRTAPLRKLKLPKSDFRWLGIFKRRRCGN